jgi:DNA-binding beta-propeller fold protein YncE
MPSPMRTRFQTVLILLAVLLPASAALAVFLQTHVNDAPIRSVRDRFPVFADVAVDPESNILAVTDENLFSLRTYDRDLLSNDVADPRTVITGNRTRVDFVCGVAIDPKNREIYTVNNDTAADMLVFKYDANGNVPASRTLRPAPVSTWGVALDLKNDEVAVTVEQTNKVLVYQRLAEGEEKPLRIIQGPDTGLADPHGIFVDAENNEIFVANHDSYHDAAPSQEESTSVQAQLARGLANLSVPVERLQPRTSAGKFVEPSITVYSRTAQDNASPVRVIRGPKTELSLPMKVFVDTVHNELFVANSGSNSILVFSRDANGDAAPIRKIEGDATNLKKPVGLFVDTKNDELWATSPELHTATVYRRTAQGNAMPLRFVRGAPDGTPAPGIGNPGGIAYDPMRQQILVPN